MKGSFLDVALSLKHPVILLQHFEFYRNCVTNYSIFLVTIQKPTSTWRIIPGLVSGFFTMVIVSPLFLGLLIGMILQVSKRHLRNLKMMEPWNLGDSKKKKHPFFQGVPWLCFRMGVYNQHPRQWESSMATVGILRTCRSLPRRRWWWGTASTTSRTSASSTGGPLPLGCYSQQ